MGRLFARLADIDGKALIPVVVALIALGGSCVGQIHQKKDSAESDQHYAIAISIIAVQQSTIDSLRQAQWRTTRELRRLRIAHGRGSRFVAWPDTIFYGAPTRHREGGGTLLKALRSLWPW